MKIKILFFGLLIFVATIQADLNEDHDIILRHYSDENKRSYVQVAEFEKTVSNYLTNDPTDVTKYSISGHIEGYGDFHTVPTIIYDYPTFGFDTITISKLESVGLGSNATNNTSGQRKILAYLSGTITGTAAYLKLTKPSGEKIFYNFEWHPESKYETKN